MGEMGADGWKYRGSVQLDITFHSPLMLPAGRVPNIVAFPAGLCVIPLAALTRKVVARQAVNRHQAHWVQQTGPDLLYMDALEAALAMVSASKRWYERDWKSVKPGTDSHAVECRILVIYVVDVTCEIEALQTRSTVLATSTGIKPGRPA
jgi:hypothetical protein